MRATEYTVGTTGPEAMPGGLPATSAYTYAVEYTLDEALAAGATRVDFDTPVAAYTDNFLGFPTGETVPAGYYDRELARWVPAPSGRVIEILAESDGKAVVDIDGDGEPDSRPRRRRVAPARRAVRARRVAVARPDHALHAVRLQLGLRPAAGRALAVRAVSGARAVPRPQLRQLRLGHRHRGSNLRRGARAPRRPVRPPLPERPPGGPPRRPPDHGPGHRRGGAAGLDQGRPRRGRGRRPPLRRGHGRRPRTARSRSTGTAATRSGASSRARSSCARASATSTSPTTARRAASPCPAAPCSTPTRRATSCSCGARRRRRSERSIRPPPASAAGRSTSTTPMTRSTVSCTTATVRAAASRAARSARTPSISRARASRATTTEPLAKDARLNGPGGILARADGSVLIADAGNARVRRVGRNGRISTFAGTGEEGSDGDDGPAAAASSRARSTSRPGRRTRSTCSTRVPSACGGSTPTGRSRRSPTSSNEPLAIAAGRDGTLYVAEPARVLRVTADGAVSTLAGDGTPGFAGDGGQAERGEALALGRGPRGRSRWLALHRRLQQRPESGGSPPTA